METAKTGGPAILGFIFLLLGFFKFVNGDDWVVWIILGVLFGGLTVFTRNKKGSDEQ